MPCVGVVCCASYLVRNAAAVLVLVLLMSHLSMPVKKKKRKSFHTKSLYVVFLRRPDDGFVHAIFVLPIPKITHLLKIRTQNDIDDVTHILEKEFGLGLAPWGLEWNNSHFGQEIPRYLGQMSTSRG